MMKYNPLEQPEAEEWFSLDEAERMDLVATYHKRIRANLPNPHLHATFHVIIENQLAEGIPAVIETLRRLSDEGLDRHDALHAIGSVLAKHIFKLLKGELNPHDPNAPYFRELSSLTAANWLNAER